MDRGFLRAGLALLALAWLSEGGHAAETLVAGWAERVSIVEAGIEVHAKLDSGAEHSSLNAFDLSRFERDGRPWVRFGLRNREGEQVTLERPVLRTARIKRHATAAQSRPVIELTLCVGTLARRVEVNLIDRSRFEYQLLVGRSFLRQGVLIDSAARYRQPPACAGRDYE